MKKNKIILSALLAISLVAISCRQDYLESQPTETLANPPAQSKLYGLYLSMVKKGTGGTTGHDDFGQKGYDIMSDMLSSDMVLQASNYGWYRNLVNFSANTDYTNNINYLPWRYNYRLIYATNEIIASLGGNGVVPASQQDKYAMGQAKALRAYCYFNLLQFYTAEYLPNEKAVPLYLEPDTKAKSRATQAEIYTQVVKDLQEAINLLDGYTRPNKGIINKYVAKGFLAYAYAAMGKDAEAATESLDIVNNGGFPVTSNIEVVRMKHNGSDVLSGGGFNDLQTRSWMWGFDITPENDLDLVSWWGQVDIYTYSYAWAGNPKTIDAGLYSSIKDYDIRKNQFFSPSDKNYPYAPANKFFSPDRKIGGQRKVTTDYIFMRVDEFYLLAAEGLSKSGNDAEAKSILKKFMGNRIESTVDLAKEEARIDALSHADLLKDIHLNTRIEFWGEGKSFFALKRNKGTIVRGDNHLYNVGEAIQYNDKRLHFQIPLQEINNNPNL
ncbi:RagB/SusD family nutrient uptake outer membrane protein [Riemerella anatipestifer]|uniref:RagB/SusD family nutrient uptake outer membrane protein n=1 Tax=Riemerella anatipestifer TaxID=34085 RepID=UPI0013731EE4|nr:RagB/SusD family nutrient uptake outer membrane protein [Riemerella anatipestifer]MBT0548861.1 RagB/SusD family nutrient uptake outer membrane protein [Riemerella anatipestifer]MBT0555174.1 RagB/SusD family nutrient uptake outer membrane protein [Riemerella anatipestifer]MBT0559624.1 RagB/SusD family nutrient uptake outer membrane protein [Riemerella anatipestifer]MCO4303912.1 RagB/SusD family nutrient uptake outer membrane protein [Riemerella anatipestifer]MCT6760881.1 RagB/SusD family nut